MSDVDDGALRRIGRDLLQASDREGWQKTPRRFADQWREYREYGPHMVVVSGMRAWPLCEQHLLPLWCDSAIGSMARDLFPGLATYVRPASQHAHRLPLQERLCHSCADTIARIAAIEEAAVMARGERLCRTMRGMPTHGLMTSSHMRGIFRASSETRMEFFALVSKKGSPENGKKRETYAYPATCRRDGLC